MTNSRDIVAALRTRAGRGQALVAVSAGSGLAAAAAAAANADLLLALNSGRFRSQGLGSLAGMLPLGDANAIVLDLAREVVAAAPGTPVIAGVCAVDPRWPPGALLDAVIAAGYQGVLNFPSVGLIDGRFRHELEATGFSWRREVDAIAEASAICGLTTCAFVFDESTAIDMGRVKADIIVPHLGVTQAAHHRDAQLRSAAERLQAIADAALAEHSDALVLFHGGPVVTADDVQEVLTNTEGIHGFVAASSVERIPVARAVSDSVHRFRSLDLTARRRIAANQPSGEA